MSPTRPHLGPRSASEVAGSGVDMDKRPPIQQPALDVTVQESPNFPSYHLPMRRAQTVTARRGPDAQISAPTQLRGTHLNEAEGTGIIAIGMALGSPTQGPGLDPVVTPWQQQQNTLTTTITGGVTNDAEASAREGGLVRTKSRKWGIFGRSKSKREKDPENILANQGSGLISPRTGLVRAASSAAAFRRTPSRGVLKKSTEPSEVVPRQMDVLGIPFGRSNVQTEPPHLLPGAQSADSPMLKLDIPEPTFDRYSVMFAHVLEKKTSVSLLERRQATQTRLRPLKLSDGSIQTNVHDDKRMSWLPIHAPETLDVPTREGSKHLERLPATTYQPAPSRLRANTSPAMLPSPSRERFDESHEAQPKRPHITRLASTKEKNTESTPASLAPIEAQQLRSRFRKEPQAVAPAEGAFTTTEATVEDAASYGLYPRRTDSRKKSSSEALPASHVHRGAGVLSKVDESSVILINRQDLPNRTSLSLSLSSVSEDEPEEDEEKDLMANPVEISIARQISVSRQQSRMLGPLKMHPPKVHGLPANPKTSTPRLIRPTGDERRPLRLATSLQEIAQPRTA